MTGFLRKAMRGAATAGAQLSAENHRARLQDMRDARLQKYQTSERVAGQEHDLEMLKAGKGSGAQQGDIQLMNYLQEHGIASSPDDAFNKIREMDTDPSKVIVDIAKSMQATDASSGMADPKPFASYLEQAEKDVNSLRERMNPKKPKPGAPTKDNAQGGSKPTGILNSGMSVDQGGMIDQALDSAPEPGAQPTSTSASLPPMNERKVGQRYDTPRGPAVWRDGGWELLNAAE